MRIEALYNISKQLLLQHRLDETKYIELALVLSKGQAHIWQEGVFICREGSLASQMFVLLEGSVRLAKEKPTSLETLSHIHAPTMIGQIGLLDCSRRSASCIANNRVIGISITKSQFSALLADNSEGGSIFRQLMLAIMSKQLCQSNELVRNQQPAHSQHDPEIMGLIYEFTREAEGEHLR
jgi:CRP-like cAMP-binding protein